MNILGFSCFYHDSAACLVKNGKVVAAAQEERFNREKGSSAFPINAIRFCLKQGRIKISDIDYFAFSEKPYLKFERVVLDHLSSYPFSLKNFLRSIPYWLQDRLILPPKLKEELGYSGKVLFIPHHLAHAASSFFVSPFRKAAIITADGVGEWTTTMIGIGEDTAITPLKEIRYPSSLGLLYTAITTYLGFKANTGEGKVMAFASYGKPRYLKKFEKIIATKPDGSFSLNPDYFGFVSGSRMYTRKFIELFGPERKPGEPEEKRHFDIAATLQLFTEETLLKIARHVYRLTKVKDLCLAGGTFLNCVTNTRIIKETPFENLFIQPAAGDAGGSLGAAVFTYHQLLKRPRSFVMKNAFLGPSFSQDEILKVLKKRKARYAKMSHKRLIKFTAQKVYENKIVGWFQGRMEFGPRALGHRTILTNAKPPWMKQYLNNEVKHREWFRPYGIIIVRKELKEYFDVDFDSPYMLLVGNSLKGKERLMSSALHVDKTSRIQTITAKEDGLLFQVVREFRKISGLPLMINTSFNDNNEPIVCRPKEAFACFKKNKIDYLVMGNYVVEKKQSLSK